MKKIKFLNHITLALIIALLIPAVLSAQGARADYEKANSFRSLVSGKVYKAQIRPNWFDDNTKFWYRNDLADGAREFILIDAKAGDRRSAFNHRRLARSLARAANAEIAANKLPFDTINFIEDGDALEFEYQDSKWKCDLQTYQCIRTGDVQQQQISEQRGGQRQGQRGRQQGQRGGQRGTAQNLSPDGKWETVIKDFNLYIKSAEGPEEFRLSHDGDEGNYYSSITWAPDSKKLVAYRTSPGDHKEVYLIQSSPPDGGRAQLRTRSYDLPGDDFDTRQMSLFFVDTKEQIKVDTEPIDFGRAPRLRWNQDNDRFTFERTERGHQRFRIVGVNAENGKTRNIVDEKEDTFIDGWKRGKIQYLEQTNELIWATEKDGWNHLYLVNTRTGRVKNQITKGQWLVRGVDRVDEDKRQIWFQAGGLDSDQDPYLVHYCRINFDGTELVDMTPGDGQHSIQYSPDQKYLIDTHSRVDLPPIHQLRRVADGSLVCELDQADISDLLDTGWVMPEVFSAKARDGETDIWGIICRPIDYDENKDYPVIEYIYAGPHSSFVPKTFTANRSMQALAELGFIVVQCDGMGTSNRSKAFHDVCWQNIKDAGFPDRILWMEAAAKKYPYMDVSRVGIYGTSAGGQNAMGAVLFHPEFYKVAVANCGCHDNRMDKASWNEQWMGYPVGPHYAESSNIDNAHLLQGKLFLIVGELDTNVPPESTLRVVDALIKAKKDFDLLFVPNGGHGAGGSYGERRKRDFFVKHLLGIEPPDWNKTERN
ncbi:MAG: prolyl oligopeptidase family serine peptidase [Planctomycetes bacterium]|nr:prolyl oligopeptidase family serine peptidase [Planctomycetota bacterium]